MRLTLLPTTALGKWSLLSIAVCTVLIGVFYITVFLFDPEVPGGFFSAPTLAIPLLLAGATGTAALLLAIFSILLKKERSILQLIPISMGMLVTIFWIGEFLGA